MLFTLADRLQNESSKQVFVDNNNYWKLLEKKIKFYKKEDIRNKMENHRLGHDTGTKSLMQFFSDSKIFGKYKLEKVKQICNLFNYVKRCPKMESTESSAQEKMRLGQFIAEYGNHPVYMAASISKNFKKYFKVLNDTHSKFEVILVSSTSAYTPYKNRFGFERIKRVC
jgi:hypothetical protein